MRSRAGATLIELVVASATGAVLMAGLVSSLYIASQSLDVGTGSLAATRSVQQVLATIDRDFQSALKIEDLTSTVIISVPDTTGDSLPETYRYTWSGVVGEPLTQSYNGATPTPMINNVQSLEWTENAITLTVPDTTGDSVPETHHLGWSGVAGAPFTHSFNGAVATDLVNNVQSFELIWTSVTMTVPDRDADSTPETIRYTWSGVAGEPLKQAYNGIETDIVSGVQSFSLAPQTRLLEGLISTPKVLFVAVGQSADGDGGLGAPTVGEQDRIDLLESWGYEVTFILQSATQTEFDTAFANVDVVYVLGKVNSGTVGTKLNAATIGVVTESYTHAENLGLFSGGPSSTAPGTQIYVTNTSHYITSGYAAGNLAVMSANEDIKWTFATLAPDAVSLTNTNEFLPYPALLVVNAGDELVASATAAGRRCQLPWGENGFDVASLNADGQTLMQRALEWAANRQADPSRVGVEGFTEAKVAADTTWVTIATPGDTSQNDLLIAAVAVDGNMLASLAPPAGWNTLSVGQSQDKVTLGIWWKLAGSGESANHTFTWASNERAYGWIMRLTGHDPDNPINDSNTNSGSSSNPTCPAVTTTVDNALILRLGGFDHNDITTDAPGLASHTAITMDHSGGTGQLQASGGAGYLQQSAAGDSGAVDFALTASEEYHAVTIAIAPEP